MDCEEFDKQAISAEALGISEARRVALLRMLAESGYIQQRIDFRPEITLKGLEYLEENSLMKREEALVFPARAGVIRSLVLARSKFVGFPRTRGGDLCWYWMRNSCSRFSPHTRG